MTKLGIIGRDTYGISLRDTFKDKFELVIYDKDVSKRNVRTVYDLIDQVNITFLCVPLKDNGEHDLYIIRGLLQEINGISIALKKENFTVIIDPAISNNQLEVITNEFTNIHIINKTNYDVLYSITG